MLQRMLNRLRGVNDDEKGFTLIELLVVILIIGVLAAIALPTFLGQRQKAQDASAKSAARNAITQMESCLVDKAYDGTGGCAADASVTALATPATGGSAASYTVVATSASGTTFSITKASPGSFTRSCSAPNSGGCPSGGATNW